jgi:isopentenyl phosphate kinase
MLTFVKLGGSLITDKQQEKMFRPEVMARIAGEIAAARSTSPDLQLLIGNGSGSFGHVSAKKHGTMAGVHTAEAWHGFAEVATVASEIGQLVANSLLEAGVPVWRLQPSASALAANGQIINMALSPVREALAHGLVPLVHGDVALDTVRGGTIISTETIFFYIAQHFPVDNVLLLGEVPGVYDTAGRIIRYITPGNLPEVEEALGGSAGTDVTGGMETKVRDMVALIEAQPTMTIRIMDGREPGLLQATLLGEAEPGTVIQAD